MDRKVSTGLKGNILKGFKNILFVTLPTILIVLILLEVFFRIVIPAAEAPEGFFDEEEKIYCYSNKKKTGLWTIGRFAEIRAKWSINNMHWNYPIDFYPVDEKELIAVIGDSFIAALQVDADENYPYLLRNKLKPDYEVYAFGIPGAPLSQYLHMSRYVNKHFDPDILIINLVHNDFDESISELKPQFFHWLQVSINQDDSITETIPHPNYSLRQYNHLRKLVYKSALFRYLYINLKVKQIWAKFKKNNIDTFEANIKVNTIKEHEQSIFKATNYLIKTISEENIEKRIVFVLIAPHKAIYDDRLNESNVLWIHEMVRTICARYDVEYIDLIPFMKEDYRTSKIKFNSDLDGHWNEYGHKFVADILYDYLKNNNTNKKE